MPPPGQSWASVIGSGADLCRPPQGRAGCCYTLCPPGQIRFPCPQGQIWPPKQTWAHVISPRGRFGLPGEDLGPPPTSPGANLPPPRADQGSCYQPQGQNWAPGWQIWAPSPAALPPPRAAQCLCYHPDSPPAPSPPSPPRRSPLTSPRCYDGCIRATPPRRKSCRR